MRATNIFRRLRRDRPWLGLAAGATFFAIAAGLRWLLGELSEGFGPMPFGPMLFLPAIMLAGLFGGIRIGLGFAVVCVLIAWTWFFPPYGTFILGRREIITMSIFVSTVALELYVIRSLNIAIDDLSTARERANTMFRELQHRVANNLQFVASALLHEKRLTEKGSIGALALEAALSRLNLMARVHRRLHDPTAIDLPIEDYLKDLCTDLVKASDRPNIQLAIKAEAPGLDLESLMTLSLIIAEVVTNSLKHAFPNRMNGNISIAITTKNHIRMLIITDDGCGISSTFERNKRSGLGQAILKNLASQLDGTLSYERGSGTTIRLVFPE
jgi:two-component sensor histidine kinase